MWKCAEQKQNTLRCNSLEYCVPFMQVVWQPLISLLERCLNLCCPSIPLCISSFYSWDAKFICNCKTLWILANWDIHLFIFLPSFLHPQASQDTSFFNNILSSDKSHSILNVLYKGTLLWRLLNTIRGLHCDLDFAYLYLTQAICILISGTQNFSYCIQSAGTKELLEIT